MTRAACGAFCVVALVNIVAGCQQDPTASAGSSEKTDGERYVASRVVTLSPHLAELMFAADAGDKLVGISAYTDFPAAAASLPIISDAFMVDQEQLTLLQPDLLLAWKNGTPNRVIDQLRDAGFRVETIRTNGLDDVATALEQIGRLTGNRQAATAAAETYRHQIKALADRYSGAQPVDVFYQVSSRPLYTVNGSHYISELLAICGGRNIFGDLGELAPMVDVEAVISRNPEAMLAATDQSRAAFDVWDRFSDLAANQYGNRFFIPAAEIGRATPRLVHAGITMCQVLESARRNKQAYQAAQ